MQGDKLDGQFVDRAWEEMQKLLDQEMPVTSAEKEKKRRPLLWLLLLFGLLGGSAAGFYWLAKPGDKIPELKETDPVALNTEMQAEIATTREQLPAEVSPSTTEKSYPKLKQTEWKKSTLTSLNTKTEAHQSTKKAATIIQGNPETVDTKIADLEQLNSILIDEPDATEPVIDGIAIEYEPIAQLDQIPGLRPGPLSYDRDIDLFDRPLPEKPAKLASLAPKHIGLDGSLIVNQFSPADGFAATAFIEYPLGKGKWSIRSGLGFRAHSGWQIWEDEGTYSYNYAESDTYDPSIDPDDPEATPITTTDIEGYRAVLKNSNKVSLSYLELPLTFSYSLKPRLSIETGMQFAYRVEFGSSNLESSRPENGFDLASISGNAANYNNRINADGPGYPYLRKFDMAPSVGMTYALNNKLRLRMAYNHGLIRLNNVKANGNFNRNLRLTASYYFK
jgi:hypothetical protein